MSKINICLMLQDLKKWFAIDGKLNQEGEIMKKYCHFLVGDKYNSNNINRHRDSAQTAISKLLVK